MQKVTPKNDTPSLTTRMKDYEDAYRFYFTKRTPVILRLDGKSFSTWTKNLEKPFDPKFSRVMQETVRIASKEIGGCAFAYSNSDEISLFLRDWDKLNTDAWFGANIQKMVSVSASIFTAVFNDQVRKAGINNPLAFFDARAFTLPKDEVVNYFIWRQHEGQRNSVQTLGQHLYGGKEIKGIKNQDLKEMIARDFPDNKWEDLDVIFRHGFAIRKDEDAITNMLPLFKDDRQYIEELIYVKGE